MWSDFRKQRLNALREAVENNKVDEKILRLLEKINENESLVTTSSCFGRIVLLGFDLNKRKQTAKFYRKWHGPVDAEEVELAVSSYIDKQQLWFKVEPFILHVSARDFDDAELFMNKMRAAGIKRGGIQGMSKDKKRISIEVQGTIGMIIPLNAVDCRWNDVVAAANEMMAVNAGQIKKLEKVRW